jgi:hypothetical protein
MGEAVGACGAAKGVFGMAVVLQPGGVVFHGVVVLRAEGAEGEGLSGE